VENINAKNEIKIGINDDNNSIQKGDDVHKENQDLHLKQKNIKEKN